MHRRANSAHAHTDGHVIHWAGLYDSVIRIISLGRESELRQKTLDLAELRPGQRVLDVGCGTGTLLIAAARSEPSIAVHGIDPAPEMLERARIKAKAAGIDAQFDVGAIESLAFEDGSFDVVFSSLMLHHLPADTRKTGLSEIFRVLPPGGRFVAIDFAGAGPLLHRMGNVLARGRAPKQHADSVIEGLEAAGFRDIVRGVGRPRYLFSVVARKP